MRFVLQDQPEIEADHVFHLPSSFGFEARQDVLIMGQRRVQKAERLRQLEGFQQLPLCAVVRPFLKVGVSQTQGGARNCRHVIRVRRQRAKAEKGMRNTTESPVKKDEAVIGDGDIATPEVAMLKRVWNTKYRQLFAHSLERWRITAKLFNFQIGEAVVTSHSQSARVGQQRISLCLERLQVAAGATQRVQFLAPLNP